MVAGAGVRLAAAEARLHAEGLAVPQDAWRHLSPLMWEHVLLVGTYCFDEPVIDGELRPLRSVHEEAAS
jgi:cytochrome oxidase assembly protein ShyY1